MYVLNNKCGFYYFLISFLLIGAIWNVKTDALANSLIILWPIPLNYVQFFRIGQWILEPASSKFAFAAVY